MDSFLEVSKPVIGLLNFFTGPTKKSTPTIGALDPYEFTCPSPSTVFELYKIPKPRIVSQPI